MKWWHTKNISGIFHLPEWLWLCSCQFFLSENQDVRWVQDRRPTAQLLKCSLSVSRREWDEVAYSHAKYLMSPSSLKSSLWEDCWFWKRGAWCVFSLSGRWRGSKKKLVVLWFEGFDRTAGVRSDDSHILWDVAVLGYDWRLQSLCHSYIFTLKSLIHFCTLHLLVQHY